MNGEGVFEAVGHARERWETVVARPDLRAAAVEELLRFDPPVAVLPRMSGDSNVEFEGVTIPPHRFVLFAISAANRDPAAFDQPDEFRFDRAAKPVLATFGPGHRACPGTHLARHQLQLVLQRGG